MVIVAVTRDEGILRIDRIVDARAERSESPRHEQSLADLHDVERRIENSGPEQIIVVGIVAVRLEKERSLALLQRPTQIHSRLPNLKRGSLGRTGVEWVARI